MSDLPYSNREIDLMFKDVHQQATSNHQALMIRFDTQDKTLTTIKTNVEYTNGKVKNIIIALVAIAFFCMGLGLQQVWPIISAFILA